jgi:hypothetical protein
VSGETDLAAKTADRFLTWVSLMFVALDQLFATWFRGFVFVWFNGEPPNPDETLSSWIGRGEVAGVRAFVIAAHLIDFFMGAGHCQRAIGK